MAKTFGAEDILAALGITTDKFEIVDSDNETTRESAVVASNLGSFIPGSEQSFNPVDTKSVTLQANTPGGATLALTLGGVGNDEIVLTRIVARQVFNDLATIQLTAHIHPAGEHLATPVAQAITTVSLGFGVLAVQLGGVLANCQSSEITWEMDHRDRQNNQGAHLVGASFGLRVSCNEEYLDDGADLTVPAGWTEDSQVKATMQNDFWTRTVRAHRYTVIP